MAAEARITINGTVLTEEQSMCVRLAVDTLAEVIGEQLGLKDEFFALSDAYVAAISRVQALLGSETAAARSMN